MRRWLVAVDGSNNAEWALHSAFEMMRPERDRLYILSVAQLNALKAILGWKDESTEKVEKLHRRIVDMYLEDVHQFGITNVEGFVRPGKDVGKEICQFIKDNDIDVAVIGYAGVGGLKEKIKEKVFGSTTRHVFEHAKCDCIVVKNEFCPREEHGSKEEVLKAEEKERERRMENKKEEGERLKRAADFSRNEFFPPQVHDSKAAVVQEEEKERERRLKDKDEEKEREKRALEFSNEFGGKQEIHDNKHDVILSEEEERKRRMSDTEESEDWYKRASGLSDKISKLVFGDEKREPEKREPEKRGELLEKSGATKSPPQPLIQPEGERSEGRLEQRS